MQARWGGKRVLLKDDGAGSYTHAAAQDGRGWDLRQTRVR